ncbi:MAG: thioredoxin family protein [Ignavibacteriales bacterium]|nr:thioredoxin family protein [Ignavibacteriales bacterium]
MKILFLNLCVILFFSSQLYPQAKSLKPKITFVELGSVNCIPCKKMQPVMKAIEQKYGEKVKVIFDDVWTEEQQPYAEQYGIRLIPTQVFLDENGKEFFRHEGFFPETEIHKIFKQRGITPEKSGK